MGLEGLLETNAHGLGNLQWVSVASDLPFSLVRGPKPYMTLICEGKFVLLDLIKGGAILWLLTWLG